MSAIKVLRKYVALNVCRDNRNVLSTWHTAAQVCKCLLTGLEKGGTLVGSGRTVVHVILPLAFFLCISGFDYLRHVCVKVL